MKGLPAVALLLILAAAPARAGFHLGSGAEHVPVPLKTQDGFLISDRKDSQAQKAFKRRKALARAALADVPSRRTYIDPSEEGCAQADGAIAILYDDQLNQRVFCRFEDGSFVEVAAFAAE